MRPNWLSKGPRGGIGEETGRDGRGGSPTIAPAMRSGEASCKALERFRRAIATGTGCRYGPTLGLELVPGRSWISEESSRLGWGGPGRPYPTSCAGSGTARTHLLLRFDRPVAALIPHADYLAFSELARRDALARAVLQGRGYDPASLSIQQFLEILAGHVKEEPDAGQ
jgi:hypothetical protein